MARSLLQAVYGPASDAVRSWYSLYRWVPGLGGVVAFFLACAIGANDVAVSLGTPVGAGDLSLPQAVLIAALMEFLGVVLVGNRDVALFSFNQILKDKPPDAGLFMWGLFIAMLAAVIWLAFVTRLKLPVSSTLPVLAGVIGIGLASRGTSGVYWNMDASGSALKVGGVAEVVVSWFLAPAIAAVTTFFFFSVTRLVFSNPGHLKKRILLFIPLYYGITVMVLIFAVLYKAAPRAHTHRWSPKKTSAIAGLSGAMAVLLSYAIVVPALRKQVKDDAKKSPALPVNGATCVPPGELKQEKDEQAEGPRAQEADPEDVIKQFNQLRVLDTVYEGDEGEEEAAQASMRCSPVCGPSRVSFGQILAWSKSFKRLKSSRPLTYRQKATKILRFISSSTYNHKIDFAARCGEVQKFDERVEDLFSFLHVLTAAVASFTHGSNEVAETMGPYAALLQIYRHSTELPERETDRWILVLGGIGVALGFAVWGWRLVGLFGGRITKLTPVRGFSIQLCALATVVFASRIELPLSTTHIVIGAIIGVGAADNIKNVNWKLLLGLLAAWVATLLCTSAFSAALYCFTVFSPAYGVKR